MKYYLHDTNSFDDEKITQLFLNFGYEGVGLFYVFLEKVAKQEKPVNTMVLKSQLKVGKHLEKCWKFMEEIGLISSRNGDTFNENLLNCAQSYEIKKEKTRIKVAEWRDRHQVTNNVTGYVSVSNLPKVKLSKVKDIIPKEKNIPLPKEEEIKEEEIPGVKYYSKEELANAQKETGTAEPECAAKIEEMKNFHEVVLNHPDYSEPFFTNR